jgi:NAD(P)-dependent dehydrogenase (short-subunit alcohol dehydrogenase family)
MNVRYDFTGKVVFVTGGTSGIGRAIARAFEDAGAKVIVASRATGCDVRDDASIRRAVGERAPAMDFAINCAGIGGDMAPLATASQDVWDDVLSVNARGTWLAMRAEIAAMPRGGVIVNLASIYGIAGRAAHHAYVASKHAVVGMTRSVALEHAKKNVRVNAICAGVTRTEAMGHAEQAVPDVVRALVDEHPMGRMATVEEIAGAARWLCSDAAAFVTGTTLNVDGGFLAA